MEAGRDQLRSFIERVLRLKAEQDELSRDIREIYAEAKSCGFDKTAMGQVVAHLRKVEKRGRDEVAEQSAIFETYLDAYHGITSGTAVATHTHEADTDIPLPADKGEEASPAPERKSTGLATHYEGSEGANTGGDDVDRSASARPSGQEIVGAEPPGIDGGSSLSGSGPDLKRAPHSSSEETSCPQHEPSGEQQCDTMGVTAGRDPQLIQPRWPFKPHCLRPYACGSAQFDRHCGDCRRAMEGEQAA